MKKSTSAPPADKLIDRLSDRAPLALLYGLAFLLPLIFWYQATDLFGAPKIALLRVVSLLLLATLAVRWAVTGAFARPRSPATWAATGFLLAVALSTVFSVHPATSLLGLNKRFFGLTTYASFFILFWMAASQVWSEGRLRSLFWASIASASLSSFLGLLQAAGVAYPLDLSGLFPDRGYGAIGNPNFLGIFLGMNLPLVLALLHGGRGRQRALSAAALLTIVAGLFATRSTGSLAGALGAVFVFYLIHFRGRLRTGNGRLALTAGAGIFLFALMAGSALIRSESGSVAGRLQIWQGVSRLAVENPWSGVGPDTVRLVIGGRLPEAKGLHNDIPEDGHNLFLTLAATVGLPGVALFILLLALLTREGLRSGRSAASPPWVGPAALGLGAAYILGQMVNPDDLVPAALFWVMAGLAAGLGAGVARVKQPSRRASGPLPTALLARGAASGLAISACLILIVISFRPFLAETYLYRAENTEDITTAATLYSAASQANPLYDRYPAREAQRLWSYIARDDDWIAGTALGAAKEAVARSPLEADNYTVLGSLYRTLGEATKKPAYYEEAIRQYRIALSHSPYQLFALRGLALTYKQLGKPKDGLRWTARYLELADNPEIVVLHDELTRQAGGAR